MMTQIETLKNNRETMQRVVESAENQNESEQEIFNDFIEKVGMTFGDMTRDYLQ